MLIVARESQVVDLVHAKEVEDDLEYDFTAA